MDRSRRVQVIATTPEGTRVALAEARRLVADAAGSAIVLLVPQEISSAIGHGDPRDTGQVAARYRDLAAGEGVKAIVRLCLCRGHREMFRWMLGHPSVIVIGGRRRRWWPT